MEERKAEASNEHTSDEQGRNDVPFSYGTDDGTLGAYGLRLPSHDEATYNELPVGYNNIPVLVTRGSTTKGPKGPLVCHVEGCQRDLSLEKKYYKRYRVCMEHLKMNAMYVDGELQRFCQQCGRFHDLAKFDGDKRNCRERLTQHNRRRRKSKREGGSDGSWEDYGAEGSGKSSKGRRSSKRLIQKTESASLWPGYEVVGRSTGEDQTSLGSMGMEMMHGIPVNASSALHGFGDGLTMDVPSSNPESLYNMVMHHVLPHPPPLEKRDSSAVPSTTTGAPNGPESLQNMTALLQNAEQQSDGERTNIPSSLPPVMPSGLGMLQTVAVSTPGMTLISTNKKKAAISGGNMPTVPMLVFSSASAPHQLNAVAIIPSATSSCSTIVPLPWQGSHPPTAPNAVGQSMPMPVHPALPIESPVSAAAGNPSPEIQPLVSFALSASGIAQGTGLAYHSTISPNQLAHFQMLMARQIPLHQRPEGIPPPTNEAVVHYNQSNQTKDETSTSR